MSKLLCNVLKISGDANAPNSPLFARLVSSQFTFQEFIWCESQNSKI